VWSARLHDGGIMADGTPKTLYQVLMLDPGADADIVSVVHRRLARRYHPDLHPGAEAYRNMLELNRAYDVLRDPARRALYDLQFDPQSDDRDVLSRWP
jgi:DnaJ-class molecular chaperone